MKLNKTKKHIVILCSGGRVVTKNSPTGGIFMLNQAKLIAKNYSKVSLLSSGYVEFSKILEKDKYLKTWKQLSDCILSDWFLGDKRIMQSIEKLLN